MMKVMILWYQLVLCLFLPFLHFPVAKGCPTEESFALLQFKNSLSVESSLLSSPSCYGAAYAKTNSWNNATNCCSWNGHVISVDLSCSQLYGAFPSNSTLFFLSHLQKLNLANNNFYDSPIPSEFGLFKKLTHLNLSQSEFSGLIPHDICRLSNLVSLDLSRNLVSFSGELPDSLGNFKFLEYLDLSYNNLFGSIPASIGNLQHLRFLDLGFNNLAGELPGSFGNLSSLEFSDLGFNHFSGQLPLSFGKLNKLTSLYLMSNNFSGHLPFSLGNLSMLSDVKLDMNSIGGPLPFSIFNLKKLQTLDLSFNQFFGTVPDRGSGLTDLYVLHMSNNKLSGKIPSWFFTLPSLLDLDISNNKLTGPFEQFQQPNSLLYVMLQNNEIHGPIPSSVFQLRNLTKLDFSSNNLSGTVDWDMFQKLENLRELDLSQNSKLSFTSSGISNFTLPNLMDMNLSSCDLREFPSFLRTLENLQTLDLSNNRISGKISKQDSEVWQSLLFLDLSHNFLTNVEHHPWNNIRTLNLRFNLLQGPFPTPPPSIEVLTVSNNKLSGEIPSLFCNLSSLSFLDMSDNSLGGVIPKCLGNSSQYLLVLDLRNNNFHGSIPRNFAKDNRLKYLNLNVNCRELEVLDVGNNKINDTFPHWLESLQELRILILRSNSFHGTIGHPKNNFPFPKLQILDLSHNGFTGRLPTSYLQNLKSLMNVDKAEAKYVGESYYYIQDSLVVDLTMKGLEIELKKILTIFTTIDFSSNRFQGEILQEVGMLKSLVVLNFSHNDLTGYIPSAFGNLTEVESLDLSSNRLVGEIPQQLAVLTFLVVFNVSYNQLNGPIPKGNQFNTFANDSYVGNLGLCGFPLPQKCNSGDQPPQFPSQRPDEEQDSTEWFDWKIALMGYGCGVVFGLSMGYIVFATRKPQWLLRLIDGIEYKNLRRRNQRRRGRRNH
uniref:Disease resistance R13L4/SHOC-2-like LRR domain-containing protein n=1 Tax=Manihot esculenta TaxID=3983 RepID=A0A2C9VQ16_MANES